MFLVLMFGGGGGSAFVVLFGSIAPRRPLASFGTEENFKPEPFLFDSDFFASLTPFFPRMFSRGLVAVVELPSFAKLLRFSALSKQKFFFFFPQLLLLLPSFLTLPVGEKGGERTGLYSHGQIKENGEGSRKLYTTVLVQPSFPSHFGSG